MPRICQRGKCFPLGATPQSDGVNFCVYSKNATRMQLLLFEDETATEATEVIELDPKRNRTVLFWHAFVPNVRVGQLYGYRVSGPDEPNSGHRFDPEKLLIDPYGKSVCSGSYRRKDGCGSGPNLATAMKSVVTETRSYDWEGDVPLYRPFSQTVIYEMHVGGFTKHRSSGVPEEKRGTFAGVIENIPHLLSLGITAVELLPIFQFDEQSALAGRKNYWGYSPVSFFAVHSGYSSRRDPLGCLVEFKDMVKALHRAGIEVILDVVYNHTAEGDEDGPTFCFRGFENSTYYLPDANNGSRYADYSGCGNTLNANHPVVRRMILDSAHYWVSVMHVDGLRFDLASILSRDESGRPVANAPVLADLETDPVLAGTKFIAEAWDTQLYQLGYFGGGNWKEWNGKFRDHVRGFFKGDRGSVRRVADRLLGSPDLYGRPGGSAEQSVNFVACHDGFTLNDLVSYNEKHNEENGEDNRDGNNDNLSWNCGVEGPTEIAAVEKLRKQQIKNLLTVTLLSVGTPMILMGDEVRRTQDGNNNAYCQDNEVSWLNWELIKSNADILRFTQRLIRTRLGFESGVETAPLSLVEYLKRSEIQWHGARLNEPDWSDDSHTLAFTARSIAGNRSSHFMLNAYWEPLKFELPEVGAEHRWMRLIDTALDSPLDIGDKANVAWIEGTTYLVEARSAVVLSSSSTVQQSVGSWRSI